VARGQRPGWQRSRCRAGNVLPQPKPTSVPSFARSRSGAADSGTCNGRRTKNDLRQFVVPAQRLRAGRPARQAQDSAGVAGRTRAAWGAGCGPVPHFRSMFGEQAAQTSKPKEQRAKLTRLPYRADPSEVACPSPRATARVGFNATGVLGLLRIAQASRGGRSRAVCRVGRRSLE